MGGVIPPLFLRLRGVMIKHGAVFPFPAFPHIKGQTCDNIFYFGGWASLCLQWRHCSFPRWQKLECIWLGTLNVLGENSTRMQRCPPQIPPWGGLHKQKTSTNQTNHDATRRRTCCCRVYTCALVLYIAGVASQTNFGRRTLGTTVTADMY